MNKRSTNQMMAQRGLDAMVEVYCNNDIDEMITKVLQWIICTLGALLSLEAFVHLSAFKSEVAPNLHTVDRLESFLSQLKPRSNFTLT
jgi:hypothetical protein